MKKEKGITLIALVVTIVVLIILAGVSISMLAGENGIITQAQNSKEETRGGVVEEARDLWRADKQTDKLTNSDTAQTLDELLDDLVKEKLLSEEEKEEIKETGEVTIGSRTIEFDLVKKLEIYPSVRINKTYNSSDETILVYEVSLPLELIIEASGGPVKEIIQIMKIFDDLSIEEIVNLPTEEKEQMLNDMFILEAKMYGEEGKIEDLIDSYGKERHGLTEECRTWKELYEACMKKYTEEQVTYDVFIRYEIMNCFGNFEWILEEIEDGTIYDQELAFQYTMVTPDGNQIVEYIGVNPMKQYRGPWFAIEVPVEKFGEYKITIKNLETEYEGTTNIEYVDSKYLITWDGGLSVSLYDTQQKEIVDVDEVYMYVDNIKTDIKDRIGYEKAIALNGLQKNNIVYEIEFVETDKKIKIPILIRRPMSM